MKLQTPTKIIVLILFQCFATTMLFAQAQAQPDSNGAKFPEAGAYANTKLTCKIIDAPNHTFCYDVYADDRLLIHQTSIPAMPGNEGFKTKEDATTVAEMVMYKIRKGEMPPTVTPEEMKEMGVIK